MGCSPLNNEKEWCLGNKPVELAIWSNYPYSFQMKGQWQKRWSLVSGMEKHITNVGRDWGVDWFPGRHWNYMFSSKQLSIGKPWTFKGPRKSLILLHGKKPGLGGEYKARKQRKDRISQRTLMTKPCRQNLRNVIGLCPASRYISKVSFSIPLRLEVFLRYRFQLEGETQKSEKGSFFFRQKLNNQG